MPNTYTQLFIQFVFAVSRRRCLIPREQKKELHSYIGGLIQHRGSKPLAIHCMPDHAHIFVGYKPSFSIPDLIKEIKVASNKFINEHHWTEERFSWQEGYGAFSYSLSQIGDVINYVHNQEQHHQLQKFKAEYLDILTAARIEFDEKYLFDFPDDDC